MSAKRLPAGGRIDRNARLQMRFDGRPVDGFDGDTLALEDGRSVRLLGINTPETGRDGEPSEPFAEDARALLSRFAAPGATLT